IGTTRDVFEGKIVKKLSYEAYAGMAEKELKKICEHMREKWNILKIYVEHRLGEVPVGEVSVIIAVSAIHRADSIQAVEYCINNLKLTVPIWKKEIYNDDTGLWKENKESCQTVQHLNTNH
ncbi:hypothetical protein HELRODRAFT_71670, partial [Helobdella robusta]|uniref:Molybdopterin synthase catalytic subunit n=1 Tax=Helobdella robusta TaxID=6412 RepID=T1G0P9_HELRO